MSPVATGFLLLVLWLCLVQPGNGNVAEILWGQCYAFCLSRHEARHRDPNQPSETIPIPSKTAVKVCRRDRYCKWCMFACDRPREFYHHRDKCLDDCQSPRLQSLEAQQACNESCWFISRSSQAKFGVCPQPSSMGKLGDKCVEQCQRDLECEGMNKCCDIGCTKVCHKPEEYDVLPPKPGPLKFRTRRDGGLLVEWPEQTDILVKPVIYVLRWWCPYSDSALHAITTKTHVKLRHHSHGIQPGTSCQFMVAAINIKGSQGFTAPRDYYKSLQNPSPPVHLETTSSKGKDGKLNVVIRWQPPHHTYGLDVDRYLVFWSDSHPKESTSVSRLQMHKKTVTKDRTSFTVRGLEPATLIFVQVKAVVKWNGRSLRGKPASTFTKTYSPPTPSFTGMGSRYPDSTMSGSSVYNIMVHTPKFHKTLVTALVTWSVSPGSSVRKYALFWGPSHCEGEAKHRKTRERLGMKAISLKQEFRMYSLRSECVYEVKIHAIDFFGDQDGGTIAVFTTPPCEETEGRPAQVVCPPKVSPPATPVGLEVRYKFQAGCICQAVLAWELSHDQPSARQPRQFKVMWGQSRPPKGASASILLQASTIIYNDSPYDVTVSGEERDACMTYLERSTHYTAQLEAQANKLKSEPAVIHFVTPDNMDPCYGDNLTGPGEKKPVSTSPNETTANSSIQQDTHGRSAPSLQQNFLLIFLCVIYALHTQHARQR